MSVEIDSTTAASIAAAPSAAESNICSIENCDSKPYKNNYCVEHYVQYGDKPPTSSLAPSKELDGSSNEEEKTDSTSSDPTSTIQPAMAQINFANILPSQPSPKSGSTGNSSGGSSDGKEESPSSKAAALKAKFARFGGGGQPCTVCSKTAYPAETIQFEGKPYHADCFSCVSCKKKLDATQAAAFEGEIYCRTCFNKQGLNRKQAEVNWKGAATTPKNAASKFGGGGNPCTKCSKTVYAGETVSFEGKIYHPDCLSCHDCSKPCSVIDLAGSYEGNPVCKPCWTKGGYAQKQRDSHKYQSQTMGSNEVKKATTAYNPRFATLGGGGGNPCSKCSKTVYSGEAVSYNGRIYHSDCLTCGDCSKRLAMADVAGQFDEKTFCLACWTKGGYAQKQRDVRSSIGGGTASTAASSRFAHLGGGGGSPCNKCSRTVYAGEAVSYDGKVYHADCLECSDCGKKCDIPALGGAWNNSVICKPCWNKGGYAQKQRDSKGGQSKTSAVSSRFATLGGGGTKCFVCEKTVYPAELLSYNARAYHSECFTCSNCNKRIEQLAQAESKGDKVYCGKCFQELGLWRADA